MNLAFSGHLSREDLIAGGNLRILGLGPQMVEKND
jgi:hypothetical protein